MKRYLLNVLIGFDLFVNCVFKGNPGETISARAGRAANQGKAWGKALSYLLDRIQKAHTANAILHDDARAKAISFLEESDPNRGFVPTAPADLILPQPVVVPPAPSQQ